VWRLGRCAYASSARVVSDHRPRPSQDGGCIRWLDVDRMKGGAGARLDRGEVKASSVRCPEERPERRNAASGAPGGARAGHTARGAARCRWRP